MTEIDESEKESGISLRFTETYPNSTTISSFLQGWGEALKEQDPISECEALVLRLASFGIEAHVDSDTGTVTAREGNTLYLNVRMQKESSPVIPNSNPLDVNITYSGTSLIEEVVSAESK